MRRIHHPANMVGHWYWGMESRKIYENVWHHQTISSRSGMDVGLARYA
jgi:hypothetical protein